MEEYYKNIIKGLSGDQSQRSQAIKIIRQDLKSKTFNAQFIKKELPYLDTPALKQLQRGLRLMPLKRLNQTAINNRTFLLLSIKKQLASKDEIVDPKVSALYDEYAHRLNPTTINANLPLELQAAELLILPVLFKNLIRPRRPKIKNSLFDIESAI